MKLLKIGQLVKDVRKTDVLLTKHVVEMEAFETTSKLDRSKVLNGTYHADKRMVHCVNCWLLC